VRASIVRKKTDILVPPKGMSKQSAIAVLQKTHSHPEETPTKKPK
jgi:hypothetical protein